MHRCFGGGSHSENDDPGVRPWRVSQDITEVLIVREQHRRSFHRQPDNSIVWRVGRGDFPQTYGLNAGTPQEPHGSAENAVIGQNQGRETSSTM